MVYMLEELPQVRGQGQWPGGPTLHLRPGAVAGRSYPMPKPRGGSLEDLPHAGGQGPRPREATPPPRSGGCMGAGGPKGATPHSRYGGVAMRR